MAGKRNMDQKSILLELRLDSQNKKLDHLSTQMRDLSQSVYSMGVTLKNSIEKITGLVQHQGMYINPHEKGRRRISGHDEGSFKVRLLELDQKLELLLNRNREHGSNLMVEGENPPLKLCWKKGDEMMISCVEQQERESSLDVKVSRGDGHAEELKSWQPCLSVLDKRIKELLPPCSQIETKEITSDLKEETKESAEALVLLEDVENEESPMDFQEELTDSSFTKGESQEVLGDFKEKLMECRPTKLLAELINPDRSTSCFAGNARQLFDENPEPNLLKGTTILYDTWHIFGGHESPNSNHSNSQFSYQRNLFTSTPKSSLDSHIGNHSNKMMQTRIFPKCLVLCSTHQLLAESWYTKFYGVGYTVWGRKPPKPPDYTCSVKFHPFSHTIIVKPPEYANFYSSWYGLCDHQSSNPSKSPDSTMMFRSNMLTVGSSTTHGCQTESQNQGLHTHSHLINLYFKYIVVGFVCKLFQESCEPKLIGGDSLISGYEENRPCSIKIDLVEGKQIHGLVIEANLQTDEAEEQFLRAKIT